MVKTRKSDNNRFGSRYQGYNEGHGSTKYIWKTHVAAVMWMVSLAEARSESHTEAIFLLRREAVFCRSIRESGKIGRSSSSSHIRNYQEQKRPASGVAFFGMTGMS